MYAVIGNIESFSTVASSFFHGYIIIVNSVNMK